MNWQISINFRSHKYWRTCSFAKGNLKPLYTVNLIRIKSILLIVLFIFINISGFAAFSKTYNLSGGPKTVIKFSQCHHILKNITLYTLDILAVSVGEWCNFCYMIFLTYMYLHITVPMSWNEHPLFIARILPQYQVNYHPPLHKFAA